MEETQFVERGASPVTNYGQGLGKGKDGKFVWANVRIEGRDGEGQTWTSGPLLRSRLGRRDPFLGPGP